MCPISTTKIMWIKGIKAIKAMGLCAINTPKINSSLATKPPSHLSYKAAKFACLIRAQRMPLGGSSFTVHTFCPSFFIKQVHYNHYRSLSLIKSVLYWEILTLYYTCISIYKKNHQPEFKMNKIKANILWPTDTSAHLFLDFLAHVVK